MTLSESDGAVFEAVFLCRLRGLKQAESQRCVGLCPALGHPGSEALGAGVGTAAPGEGGTKAGGDRHRRAKRTVAEKQPGERAHVFLNPGYLWSPAAVPAGPLPHGGGGVSR